MTPTEKVVLDTSAYSRFRSGHLEVTEWIALAYTVVVPVTVLGELDAGFELGRRAPENRRILAEFLDEPFVRVLDVTASTVRYYARIYAALRRAGTPIPVNDMWIAAATVECNGHLLTFDRDYSRIPNFDHTLFDTP